MGIETLPLKRFDAEHGEHCAVLLHELGETHRYWTCGPVTFALPGHCTILIDLLGFGESPKPWIRYSVECHVAALQASVAGECSGTLVGHSLGASSQHES